MSDRLHVHDALPTAAGGVLGIGIRGDDGGEDRRSQFERSLEGGLQAYVGGRVGRVGLQLEQCVWRVFRKVD